MLATHLAACAAALTWILLERIKIGKATSIGIVTGAVAGLATVTPAAGYVSPAGGAAIGALGSLTCFGAVLLIKQRWRVDDSLDVFAVHGVGGMVGSLLLAPFGSAALGGGRPCDRPGRGWTIMGADRRCRRYRSLVGRDDDPAGKRCGAVRTDEGGH